MQIDDLLSNGMVRRWSLVDGQARCVEDAIGANDAGALEALKQNSAIRALLAPVDAYEAALAIIARGEPDNGQPRQIPDPAAVRPEDAPDDWAAPLIDNPAWSLLPRTVETIGQDGEPQTAPEPRWQAYDDAEAEIATASETTKALARWRAAEAGHGSLEETVAQDASEAQGAAWEADRDAVLAALATEAAKPLAVDPRPVPEAISRRQFGFGAVMVGKMAQAEALAFVNSGTLPAAVEAIVQSLPADQQFAARMSLASNEFHRHNPATMMFLPLMQIDDATADACWRYGATFA